MLLVRPDIDWICYCAYSMLEEVRLIAELLGTQSEAVLDDFECLHTTIRYCHADPHVLFLFLKLPGWPVSSVLFYCSETPIYLLLIQSIYSEQLTEKRKFSFEEVERLNVLHQKR